MTSGNTKDDGGRRRPGDLSSDHGGRTGRGLGKGLLPLCGTRGAELNAFLGRPERQLRQGTSAPGTAVDGQGSRAPVRRLEGLA